MEINQITEKIIKCAIDVHKSLGPGLLESAYEECLVYELEKDGLKTERQKLKVEEILRSGFYSLYQVSTARF